MGLKLSRINIAFFFFLSLVGEASFGETNQLKNKQEWSSQSESYEQLHECRTSHGCATARNSSAIHSTQ